MIKPYELNGKKFGRLTVIDIVAYDSKGNARLYCLCDCGQKPTVNRYNLISGHTTSCGCARKDALRKTATTHGVFRNRFYNIYRQILRRCNEPNHKAFKNYGGKGIKNLWNSFEEFKGDMFESYTSHIDKHGEKNTTIDRIDNNGHYSKKNCRWATWKIQANNKTFPRRTVSMKRNSRKNPCPFCGVGTNVSHKVGCEEVNRLLSGKRVIKYSSKEVIYG